MKKALSILLALTLLLGSMMIFASCGGSFQLPEAPNGYQWYENSDIYFAYPDNWSKSEDDGYAQLSASGGGNNIVVSVSDYDSTFDNMTVETFRTQLLPMLEQAGMTVSGEKVTHNTEKGYDIAVVTYKITYMGISMYQTLYMFRVNNSIYSITVTELTRDSALIETVFDTLNVK